jgi:glycosyltransferase involved in cell wall biosynthesis
LLRLGSPPLYVHFAHKPATVGRYAALLAGVPYGLSTHAKDIWLTPAAELARKIHDATVVLTCTEEGHRYLCQLSAGQTPVTLAYHGVDVEDDPQPSPRERKPVVLCVARLVAKKGHRTLLRAAAILKQQNVDFSLRIAGDGPEWPRLQRLVHELELGDRVCFLGPLSEHEVRTEYRRADVFALPCCQLENGDRDGIPNVILEAMAHGLPVVSTSASGVKEAIVHGESGLLAAQEDEFAFAAYLERLLGDRELRERIGRQAHARVAKRFDRASNLPTVLEALYAAGLIPRSRAEAGPRRALRAVA